MKNLSAQGHYTSKKSGEQVNYDYDYPVLEGSTAEDKVQDAVSQLGAEAVASKLQRILKVDANNTARERAKTANGDSTRKALTEEEKAERAEKRRKDRELLNALKEKGLSAEDIANL